MPNHAGPNGYAATYSGGNFCVEWSKHTRKCNNTSPCYVMANGDGPCGDLDTKGDVVLAYDFPPEYYNSFELKKAQGES